MTRPQPRVRREPAGLGGALARARGGTAGGEVSLQCGLMSGIFPSGRPQFDG